MVGDIRVVIVMIPTIGYHWSHHITIFTFGLHITILMILEIMIYIYIYIILLACKYKNI